MAITTEPGPLQAESKVGIALGTIGQLPIHGLHLYPTETTNGWYFWCGGECSQDVDFFAPLHVEHIAEHLPEVIPYLDLPPGYRFMTDGQGFEDIWFDEDLLT